MAKQGMNRPENSGKKHKNSTPPVPALQGKAKQTKIPARPIIAGTASPALKVYHGIPHNTKPFPNEYTPTGAALTGDAHNGLITEIDLH